MQRLENLEITKVAFVPEGDNKKADVLLFKSKPAEGGDEGKTELTVTEKEAGVIKRVLLAIGKAFGFSEEAEIAPRASSLKSGSAGASGDANKPAGDLDADIKQKSAPAPNSAGQKPGAKPEKGVDEMKIDKSKLTPEELAQLEAIEKKAGVQEPKEDPPADGGVKKTEPAAEPTKKSDPAPSGNDGEDIYKGLHPAVAAELKELRKRADAAEEREMLDVAKKYELLGKKPEELAKTLKTLKAAGGSAYDDMIGVLDASLATVEKSGAFSEVGKSGSGHPDAWDQIEKHAAEILKAAPTLSLAEAIEKACAQHPDLVAEYENNR